MIMSQYKCSKSVSITIFILFATKPVKQANFNCAHLPRTKRKVVCQDVSNQDLGEIPSNIKRDTTNINLSENFIKILKTGAFKGLGNLLQIDLEENSISEIQEGAFEGIPSRMESLLLRSNNLKKLEAKMWRGLKEIAYLAIQYNELTTITYDCFGPNLRVRELILSNNKIKHIDSNSFKSMNNGLEYLSLHDNKLEWIPCFQHIQNSHHVDGKPSKNKTVLTMSIIANPFRCQPCSCWAPVDEPFHCGSPWDLLSVESKETLGHDCRSLYSMLESSHGHFQCCEAIETEANEKCLSNPEIFEDAENALYPRNKDDDKCSVLDKENMQQTTIHDSNLASDKELNNGITNTVTSSAIKIKIIKFQNDIIAVVLIGSCKLLALKSILYTPIPKYSVASTCNDIHWQYTLGHPEDTLAYTIMVHWFYSQGLIIVHLL